MNGEIELPTMEARNWIASGARACGYPEDEAALLGYLAWWLENRQIKGVTRTTVYLLMIHGTPYQDLQMRRQDDRLIGLCPVGAAERIAYSFLNGDNSFDDWTGGMATADPLIAGVLLLCLLEYKYNVHLRYNDQHLILMQDGVAMLSESLTGFALCDFREGIDMAIRLVRREDEEVSITWPYEKRETLFVAQRRYLPDGGFAFN